MDAEDCEITPEGESWCIIYIGKKDPLFAEFIGKLDGLKVYCNPECEKICSILRELLGKKPKISDDILYT